MSLSLHKTLKEKKWREKSVAELRSELQRLKGELFNERFARAVGKLENYRQLPKVRKQIAVLHTLIREKELAEAGAKGGQG